MTRTPARKRPYATDLAFVHHRGFTEFSRAAAPALLQAIARTPEGLVVDLGCGSGEWLRVLTDAGYEALGIDQSPAFVRLARQVARRARVRVGIVGRIAIPPCRAVTALGEVLNYRPTTGRPPSLATVFRQVHRALEPGGVFVFDLVVSGRAMSYDAWSEGPSWVALVRVREDSSRGRLTRDITTFRRIGERYRRARELHVLQVPRRSDVTRWLRAAGFTVRTARAHGSAALGVRRVAFYARKPPLVSR